MPLRLKIAQSTAAKAAVLLGDLLDRLRYFPQLPTGSDDLDRRGRLGLAAGRQLENLRPRGRRLRHQRLVGGVEAVPAVQVEDAHAAHHQIAVFLDNRRVRLQTTPERLDHVEVESEAIGVGHQISLPDLSAGKK